MALSIVDFAQNGISEKDAFPEDKGTCAGCSFWDIVHDWVLCSIDSILMNPEDTCDSYSS